MVKRGKRGNSSDTDRKKENPQKIASVPESPGCFCLLKVFLPVAVVTR